MVEFYQGRDISILEERDAYAERRTMNIQQRTPSKARRAESKYRDPDNKQADQVCCLCESASAGYDYGRMHICAACLKKARLLATKKTED